MRYDLTGKRFGRLTVIEECGRNAKRGILWRCVCDCGKEAIVPGETLRRGESQSCGCLRADRMCEALAAHGGRFYEKHGGYKTRLYRVWRSMINRCANQSDEYKFSLYGGRGVCVCDEWKGFSVFQAWALANEYSDELSIDQVNPDGDYCPENCRWVTAKGQARNRRNNVLYGGKCLAEWAEITGIGYQTLRKRLDAGWTLDDVLFTPVRGLTCKHG